MDIVRDGDQPRRELAVCWRVEVMKGALGERAICVSFMSVTCQVEELPSSRILSTSFFSVGSTEQTKVLAVFPPSLRSASIVQNVCGKKARISRSRSIMMRRAGDWT